MKMFLFILSVLACCHLHANNNLDKRIWESTTGKYDYTETYKEFETDTTAKKDKTFESTTNNWQLGEKAQLFRVIVVVVIGALLLTLIILLIYSLSKIKPVHKISENPHIEEVDNPNQYKLSDLERYLQEALDSKNLRLAVRIHFLMLIKALEENNLISWKKDKTNRDYLRELTDMEYYDNIKALVSAFEKVWYANYTIQASTYQELSLNFKRTKEKIES